MRQQKYIVRLSAKERADLESIVKKRGSSAFRIRHAQILLHSDATVGSQSALAIASMLHCQENTVYEVRKRLVEQGFSAVPKRKKRETPAVEKKNRITSNHECAFYATYEWISEQNRPLFDYHFQLKILNTN